MKGSILNISFRRTLLYRVRSYGILLHVCLFGYMLLQPLLNLILRPRKSYIRKVTNDSNVVYDLLFGWSESPMDHIVLL